MIVSNLSEIVDLKLGLLVQRAVGAVIFVFFPVYAPINVGILGRMATEALDNGRAWGFTWGPSLTAGPLSKSHSLA